MVDIATTSVQTPSTSLTTNAMTHVHHNILSLTVRQSADITTAITAIATGIQTRQPTSATDTFRRHITRARALPSEAITRRTVTDATMIHSPAHIRMENSATTGITTTGQLGNVTRLTVTFPAPGVTYLTTTALMSSIENVTSTHTSRMTAVHADCLLVSCTLTHAITNPTIARSRCSSLVMENVTRIRLQ